MAVNVLGAQDVRISFVYGGFGPSSYVSATIRCVLRPADERLAEELIRGTFDDLVRLDRHGGEQRERNEPS